MYDIQYKILPMDTSPISDILNTDCKTAPSKTVVSILRVS